MIAIVNGEKITEADFNSYAGSRAGYMSRLAQIPQGRQGLLNMLIEQKLVMQDAEKQGVSRDPKLEREVEIYRANLIKNEMHKRVMEKAQGEPASAQEIEAYYNQHKANYSFPERVTVKKIAIKDKAKAEQVYKKVKAEPARFEELAKQYSEDVDTKFRGGRMDMVMRTSDAAARFQEMPGASPAGRPSGGETGRERFGAQVAGTLARRSIPDAIADKVFPLKDGQISQLINYDNQYLIFQMVEHKPAESKPLEEVKAQIGSLLKSTRSTEKWKQYLDGLKNKAKIKIVDKSFEPGNQPGLPSGNKNYSMPESTPAAGQPLSPMQKGSTAEPQQK